MARYTGPVCRICRREGVKLFLKGEKCLTKCTLEKRNSPPGMHQQRRRKVSDFALQLREKQKARRMYGVLERQMKNTFDRASEVTGATGETLLINLECRLDNAVYRAGFAKSRPQARQLVDSLDPAGAVTDQTIVYVPGELLPGSQHYFDTRVRSRAASYRVLVFQYEWIQAGGGDSHR